MKWWNHTRKQKEKTNETKAENCVGFFFNSNCQNKYMYYNRNNVQHLIVV